MVYKYFFMRHASRYIPFFSQSHILLCKHSTVICWFNDVDRQVTPTVKLEFAI